MKSITFSNPDFLNGKENRVFYDTSDDAIKIIIDEIFMAKCYERGLEYLSKIKNPIVVDVGAHVGMATLYFSQKKDAEIYSLEPIKENFDCLVQNIKDLPVTVYNMGIMPKPGNYDMYLGGNPGDGGQTLYAGKSSGKKENVFMTSLNKFIEVNKFDHIDLLKIDTEGAEYEIFFSDTFFESSKKIKAIIGESHLDPVHPYALETILPNRGYTLEWLPYPNMLYTWTIQNSFEKHTGTIKVPTLFFAYKP